MIYRCYFSFKNEIVYVDDTRGIAVFESGFWINSDMEYTYGGDSLYWIPPSQIKYIEKITN